MEIEQQTNTSPCGLTTFLHAFIMDKFVERIKTDMETKVEIALKKVDVWSAITTIPTHTVVEINFLKIEFLENFNELCSNFRAVHRDFRLDPRYGVVYAEIRGAVVVGHRGLY